MSDYSRLFICHFHFGVFYTVYHGSTVNRTVDTPRNVFHDALFTPFSGGDLTLKCCWISPPLQTIVTEITTSFQTTYSFFLIYPFFFLLPVRFWFRCLCVCVLTSVPSRPTEGPGHSSSLTDLSIPEPVTHSSLLGNPHLPVANIQEHTEGLLKHELWQSLPSVTLYNSSLIIPIHIKKNFLSEIYSTQREKKTHTFSGKILDHFGYIVKSLITKFK